MKIGDLVKEILTKNQIIKEENKNNDSLLPILSRVPSIVEKLADNKTSSEKDINQFI